MTRLMSGRGERRRKKSIGMTPMRINEMVLGRLKTSLISGAIGILSNKRFMKSIIKRVPLLLFSFQLILFQAFFGAEIDCLPIDLDTAGMGHRGIGMA